MKIYELKLSDFDVLLNGLLKPVQHTKNFVVNYLINYYVQFIFFFASFDTNPTARHSVYSVIIGGFFYWTSMFCTNQASVQKCMSLKSIGTAKTAIYFSVFGELFCYFWCFIVVWLPDQNCALNTHTADRKRTIMRILNIKINFKLKFFGLKSFTIHLKGWLFSTG